MVLLEEWARKWRRVGATERHVDAYPSASCLRGFYLIDAATGVVQPNNVDSVRIRVVPNLANKGPPPTYNLCIVASFYTPLLLFCSASYLRVIFPTNRGDMYSILITFVIL